MKDSQNQSKEKFLAEIERLKKELKRKKRYGLVWEEKTEDVVELCKEKLPVLKEVQSKEIITDKDKPVNLLIEGDNYHALSVLNYTHAKKIDVIYIDPPYNTGNKDFIFNDCYVDKEDAYRHSKWLAFMEKRLKLAKNLLKDNGMIFISIDDNEVAQLKLLMGYPDLFGEENFRNIIVVSRVKKNIQERDYVKTLNLGHSFILFYGKSKSTIDIPVKYQKKLERWHAFDAPGVRLTMEYKLFSHRPPKRRHWMFEKSKAEELTKKGLLRPNPKTGKPQYKLEASDKTRLDTNWTDLIEGSSKWKFENGEKNIELIKRIIKMHPQKDVIVLDFFAGSGTTGNAVLELNKEDSGNRKFILCTNNENNNGNGYKIAADICYPRIKKVIKGYKDKPSLGGNLKYFKTDFVDAEPTDKNKIRLTEQATEMLCIKEGTFQEIENRVNFKIFKNTNHYTGIIFDQSAIPAFKKAIKGIKGKFSVYVFSLGDETFDDEFKDVKQRIKLSPIPEAILRVYRRIFK